MTRWLCAAVLIGLIYGKHDGQMFALKRGVRVSASQTIRTGIIGGTGLYKMPGLEITERREIETPFGAPSAPLTIGRVHDQEVVFLPRHGEGHGILPSEICFRANIWALKQAGARNVISVSATGSLREEIEPGDIVVPSQYFDWTRGRRVPTFFGDGMVGHISTAEPTSRELTDAICEAAARAGVKIHRDKTYACVEGPRLGTRAESFFLRGAGCDLVGMTNVPEVFLACEARLNYCTIAIATDYDCWLDDPSQHVSVEAVIALYGKSIVKVQQLLDALFTGDYSAGSIPLRPGVAGAVMTPAAQLSAEQKRILDFLDR